MRRRFEWLFRFVLSNLGWKLLSLAIAVGLWAFVASEPELATITTVPVQYKNLPDELEISSEPPDAVSLELRGPSGQLQSGVHPAVVLDMSGVQPGERTYSVGNGNVKLARGVHLVRAIPSELRYRFERRATRLVTVVPHFANEGQNGYEVARAKVDPEELSIVGPASHVNRMHSVATDAADVSGVVGSSEFRVNAYTGDPFVRFAGSPQVNVTVVMKKK
jgi:YbbR domain-containing protein